MIPLLTGLLVGTLVGWLIASRALSRPSSEKPELYPKLPPEVRRTLLQDSRPHLSASDLRELLGAPQDGHGGYVRKQVCPQCGTDRLYHGQDYAVNFALGTDGKPHPTALPQETVECEECGWKDTASGAADGQDHEGSG